MRIFWNKLHKIGDVLRLPDLPSWLMAVLMFVLILRIPSFFEPYNYGDEMIYLSLGNGVRQGLTLYKDIHDNKPPLLYLTAAAAGNLFWFKVILTFWNLATIAIFYNLSKKIFDKNLNAQKISTAILAILTTIPLLEGNIVNAELFMIGPAILAFLILLSKNLNSKKIFWAGALFGISSLFKIPAVFEIPVIVIYWLCLGKENWKNILSKSLILFSGFLTPVLLSFAWYFLRGAFSEYLIAAFLQNFGYISSWRFGSEKAPFLVRNGSLLIRAGVAAFGCLVVFLSRKKLSPKFIFISVWLILALFGVTLSERPYPHYLIQALPAISLLLGIFFAEKSYEQSLAVIPLALALFVPFYYKFWIYPTGPYYARFLAFASGRMNRDAYFNSFNGKTVRNYQIADFFAKSSMPKEKVFVWDSDAPTIYALSRKTPPIKYVANYHVLDYSDTNSLVEKLKNDPPKFIVTTAGYPLPEILPLIRKGYILIQQIDDAQIWSRVYNPSNAF